MSDRYLYKGQAMDYQMYKVRRLINDIKKRWKYRAVMQGAALTIFSFLIFASAYMLVNYRFEMPPLFQGLYIAAASLVTLWIFVRYVLPPLFRKLDERQIALYIEEKIPGLEDRINSAAELGRGRMSRRRSSLLDRLIDDAARKAQVVEISTVVDRTKERILSYSSTALLAIFLLFVYTFLDDIRDAASQIEVSLNPIAELRQEFMNIIPGDVLIEKGESQEIVAELKNNTDDELYLHYKSGDGAWRKAPMEKGLENPVFMYQLLNIQEPITYFVELNQEHSPEYTISIYEFPKVAHIDLKYTYPRYTGLPPRTEEGTGDIYGLRGSEVALTINTTGSAVRGEMVLDSGSRMPLQFRGDGVFTVSIGLEEHDLYHVDLTDMQGKNNKFPEEYQITPVDDEPPLIFISDPQSDVRANPVEEVLLAVTVSDDFGIKDVRLQYTVNGGKENLQPLMERSSAGKKTADGAYIFYLEDYGLQAGDVISYYVEAEDYYQRPAAEASDMYFIEIISLDNSFRQAENPGGSAGGGGQQSQVIMSQQKIIAATWKLLRTRNDMTDSEFAESLEAVVQAQSNLKENIDERINSTAFSTEMLDEDNRKIAEYFRAAVVEMDEAIGKLRNAVLKDAIREEQQALTNLLRADALNKEKRVQRQNQSGGGGSGASSSEERMTELMDLELDITKNKYEMQQQRQQQGQEIDEAMRKVQELARKQQKLADNSQQRMREEEVEKRELDRLRREQEQLRREAEELANQMRRQSRDNERLSREMQQRLDQAIQNMQQASEELDDSNLQRSAASQQQALNELQRLQREMQTTRNDDTRQNVDDFVNNFMDLKRKEDQLAQDLRDTYREAYNSRQRSADKKDIERLVQKREEVMNDLDDIGQQSREIEQMTRREDPGVATTMRNFRQSLRREDIERNMEESKIVMEQNWLMYANLKEDEIRAGLERIEGQVRRLENELPLSEEEQLNRNLQDTRELLTKYNEIMQAAEQSDQAGRPGEQDEQEQQRRLSRTEAEQRSRQQQSRQQEQQQGQGGGSRNTETARMQRQLEQMQQMLDNMQRSGGLDANMQQDLRSAEAALTRAHNTGVLLDEAGKEYFRNSVYAPLSSLEMQLLKQLDAVEMEKKLYGSRGADVPPQYRKLVDRYYESIAKARGTKKKNDK